MTTQPSFHFGSQGDPLAGLNEAQKPAVLQTDGPVLILAGAGSGKTRVMVHRIAHIIHSGKARPWEVLAMTFTNKAAGELRSRVEAMVEGGASVAAGTFHSTMLRLLRQECEVLGYPKAFSIYDNRDSVNLVKSILAEFNEEGHTPRTIHSIISRLKNDLLDPDEYSKTAHTPLERTVVATWRVYQQRLKRNGAMDFDDLLLLPIELFRKHPAILQKWSGRWRYLHVDEYQDTNSAQFELIRLLAGPRPNLCVVGDDDQAIYGWRGAQVENIFRFKDVFEGVKVFRLEQNYRSTQSILALANAVVAKSSQREAKNLWTARKGGALPRAIGTTTDMDEAKLIAESIDRNVMRGNNRYSDHAILYRTNSQSRLFESMLRSRGTPHQVVGNIGFLSRKEVKDAFAYLLVCHNPRDDQALRRIVSTPPRGIGASTLAKLSEWADLTERPLVEALSRADEVDGLNTRAVNACKRFASQIEQWRNELDGDTPLQEWALRVLEESEYLRRIRSAVEEESRSKHKEAEGRLENLEAFIDDLAEFEGGAESLRENLDLFLKETPLMTDLDGMDPGEDSVKLMTVHAAKGLEFPVVYVTGMEKGLFPLESEGRSDDMDEERRLFYVAVTRAEQELTLSYSQQRRVWGKMEYRAPSPFLAEIPTEALDHRKPSTAGGGYGGGHYNAPGRSRPASASPSSKARPAWPPKKSASSRGTGSGAARTSSDVPAVRAGDLIEHGSYGRGIVVAVMPFRNDIKVQVEFDGSGTRTLLQSVARLQPVKDFSK